MDCEQADLIVVVEVAMLHWLGVIGGQLMVGISTVGVIFAQNSFKTASSSSQ